VITPVEELKLQDNSDVFANEVGGTHKLPANIDIICFDISGLLAGLNTDDPLVGV
jgi:hypothetical protein